MFKDVKVMKNLQNLTEKVTVTTAKEGEELRATKRGSVKFTTRELHSVVGEIKIKKFRLYDVLFIPELQKN